MLFSQRGRLLDLDATGGLYWNLFTTVPGEQLESWHLPLDKKSLLSTNRLLGQKGRSFFIDDEEAEIRRHGVEEVPFH